MIQNELVTTLGRSALSLRTVYRWIQLAKTRGGVLEDIHRVGPRQTGCSRPNVTRVHRLIEANPHISLNSLEARTKLCRGTLVNIIQLYLRMRTLSSRWTPHDLSPFPISFSPSSSSSSSSSIFCLNWKATNLVLIFFLNYVSFNRDWEDETLLLLYICHRYQICSSLVY